VCGRFVLLTDLSIITETFKIQEIACDYKPDNNISPGQQIAAVIHKDNIRLLNFRWGLIPSWTKDPSIGNRMFNARAEAISEKPSFKNAFKKRRCLIIADGFYEWKTDGKNKIPMQIYMKSKEPFGFAGLFEHWMSPEGQLINSCTIITTEPNELIKPIHERMPVIVPKHEESAWIDSYNTDYRSLLTILKPYPSEDSRNL